MPEIRLSSGALHYLDPAPEKKEAVLLLHGLGATGDSWLPQFSALTAAGFRPLAPDIPGFGRSPAPRRWSVESVVETLVALLDALALERVHVVGLSMGGVLAQRLALAHPERVHRLVLVSTFARLAPAGVGPWLYFLLRFALLMFVGLERQGEVVARRLFPRPEHATLRAAYLEQIAQADPRAYRAAMWALARFDSRAQLARLQMPTLVVIGEEDTTVPPTVQTALAQSIPQAAVWRLSGHGHALTATAPDLFNARLVAFLQEGK